MEKSQWSLDQIANRISFEGEQYISKKENGREIRFHDASQEITYYVGDLSPQDQYLARQSVKVWSEYSGLKFAEVDIASNAYIKYTATANPQAAYAQPHFESGNQHASYIDVNIGSEYAGGSTNIDSHRFSSFLHETGHALGLSHTFDSGTSDDFETRAEFSNDSKQLSLMSYFYQSAEDPLPEISGFDPLYNPGSGGSSAYAITPMSADIIAIQNFYQTEISAFSGNTVYGVGGNTGTYLDEWLNFNAPVAITIMDSGGLDTLNLSSVTADQIIDLNPESISDVNGLKGSLIIARGTNIENVIGGAKSDTITGNKLSNQISGGSGDDILHGGDGNDSIFGGADDDIIYGGDGADEMLGGIGNDTINTGDGNDIVDGGDGDDFVFSVNGNSIISGGEQESFDTISYALLVNGNITYSSGSVFKGDPATSDAEFGVDSIENFEIIHGTVNSDKFTFLGEERSLEVYAGEGNDVISGSDGDDVFHGEFHNDRITGEKGNDIIFGGQGNDALNGGEGDDILFGGAGTEIFFVESGNDVFDGGSDIDIALYTDLTDTIERTIMVSNGESMSGDFGLIARGDQFEYGLSGETFTDKVSNVEHIYGTNEDDIYDSIVTKNLYAQDGNDYILLKGNLINVDAGAGIDTVDLSGLSHGVRWDGISVSGSDRSTIASWDGVTKDENIGDAYSMTNVNRYIGTEYNDHIDIVYGNYARGGGGDDIIVGDGSSETFYGDDGNDTINASNGNDKIYGGAEGDNLIAGYGTDVLQGGHGKDLLQGKPEDWASWDIISYEDVAQTEDGSGGVHVLGHQNKTLEDGYGFEDTHRYINEIIGSANDDTITSGAWSSSVEFKIRGRAGDDTLYIEGREGRAYGDEGDDYLSARNADGSSYSWLYGGIGDDTLLSKSGTGTSRLYGEDGNDILRGEAGGKDLLKGGAGSDFITTGGSLHNKDNLYGEDGADTFVFGSGSIYRTFGQVILHDFNPGEDHLVFTDEFKDQWDAASKIQDGSDLLVDISSVTNEWVRIKNATEAEVAANLTVVDNITDAQNAWMEDNWIIT